MYRTTAPRNLRRAVEPDRTTHLVFHSGISKAKSLELAAIRLTWANKFLPDTTTLRIVVVGAVT
jgi:hypothetical protein